MVALDRRTLLAVGLAGTALAASGQATTRGGVRRFAHGVASGDPGTDRMLLWTRIDCVGGAEASGEWQVATDRAFADIAARGAFRTDPDRDHIVKVDVDGLRPGTRYWYRFVLADAVSPIGQTRTLPTGELDRLDLVLACCAMYTQGEFHAYRAIADREALDLVLFVGDYIYEYGAGGIRLTPDIRTPEPPGDTVTLADYRARYAQWRRDPALQAAHARAPWICMWDDHEIANDDWTGGAQHHDPATQGPWDVRKAAAVQAYFEWMPIRDPDPDRPYAVERSYAFGDLATLVLPETRLTARDRPLSLTSDLAGRDPASIAAFRARLDDPDRRMIGPAQHDWLAREVAANDRAGRPWLLFGSPTIMGHYVYPDLAALVPDATKARIDARWPGFTGIFDRTGLDLPLFNLDSWDGYPAERERVYDLFERTQADVIVLSGDSHMAWINELHRGDRRLALELSASTLTGPAMGLLLGAEGDALGQQFVRDNRDVAWCDPLAVGFVAIAVTPASVEATFVSVLTPRAPSGHVVAARRVTARKATGGAVWTDG